MSVERPKNPPKLEIKDNFVELQNNFNYYCHFQDHSNAYEIFHLGTQALYFYSHITWLQHNLLYPVNPLIYHHPWKKGKSYSRHKAFLFFFLKGSYVVFHARNSQNLYLFPSKWIPHLDNTTNSVICSRWCMFQNTEIILNLSLILNSSKTFFKWITTRQKVLAWHFRQEYLTFKGISTD